MEDNQEGGRRCAGSDGAASPPATYPHLNGVSSRHASTCNHIKQARQFACLAVFLAEYSQFSIALPTSQARKKNIKPQTQNQVSRSGVSACVRFVQDLDATAHPMSLQIGIESKIDTQTR